MALAFLRDRLDFRGVQFSSGGFARQGAMSPTDTVEAMREYRFDLADHRSRMVTRDDIEAADLVLGMEFEHGRKLAAMAPQRIDRIYTLPEFVDRAEADPAAEEEVLDSWLARLQQGRPKHPHLGARSEWEVIDPFGRPPRVHRQAATQINELVDRLVEQLDSPLTVAEAAERDD